MKKILLFCLLLTAASPLFAKSKKIVVQPADAKIYIDGNYVSDGSFEVRFGSKDDFVIVKLEAPGYVTKEAKIFRSDRRNIISFNLKEDDSFEDSVSSDLANRYVTIRVRDDVDEDLAWKLLAQVALDYFDEFRTSDKASGYMTTVPSVYTFRVAEVKVRTSIQIKEITNDGLAYQIRINSEICPLTSNENGYKKWDRVLKKYESLINEMQQRIGKN